MALYKYHYIELDTKRSPRISLQNIVAGETGNRIWITVTNNGETIDMSEKEDDEFIYRVALRIDSDLGTRRQDSDDPDGGITFIEANTGDHGKINILLSADSFTVGKNRCRLEIYSKRTEDDDTLICSAEWTFAAAGNPTGENVGTAYPLMAFYEQLAKSWAVGGTGRRECEDTDNSKYYKELAEAAVKQGVVSPSVEAWLDANAERLALLKEYVTPEMYGAYGDGTHDDTSAFISMFASGKKNIFIPQGTYKITDIIVVPNGTKMCGCGSASVLKRVTTSDNSDDFILVGGESDVGLFDIIVESQDESTFHGAIIKINEESLASYNRAELYTNVHDISALCTSETAEDSSALELSLKSAFGTSNSRTGFCALYVSNYNVRCASGIMLDYYCHAYTTDSSYWITGITFTGGFIRNCKWGFFPLYSDSNLFGTGYSGSFTAVIDSIQMQAQTSVKGFLYLPYNKGVKMRLIGCIPWDFSSYNTYPFYFDYRRIMSRQNIANDYMESDSNTAYTNFVGVTEENELVPMNAYNLGSIVRYIGKTNIPLETLSRLTGKTYYVPHTAKAVKLYSVTLSSGRRTVVFKYLSVSNGRQWATVTVNWIVGNSPEITIDGGTTSIKFGYILKQSGSSYTLEIYAVRSNSGGLTYTCFESIPFSNSMLSFDNSGQASSYLATLNMDAFTNDEVYLSSIPDNLTFFATVQTPAILIKGTNAGGADKIFKLNVVNGELTISESSYWGF